MATRAAVEGAPMNLTPEAWGMIGTFLVALSGWVKVLLDQRGTRQAATLDDAGKRREEWHEEAQRLQTRLETLDTNYKARIDAMDDRHKQEVKQLQEQNAKALADHYDMVKIQLNMSVRQGLLEEHIRDLETVVRRLDEHIVDLYVSIQQEESAEVKQRILGRLKTARPAVLLRNTDPAKGEKS